MTVVHHRILFLTFVQCDVFLIDEGKTRKVHVANIKDGPDKIFDVVDKVHARSILN